MHVLRRRPLVCALLAWAALGTGCGPEALPQIEPVGEVYGEAMHQKGIDLEVGERFTVALPTLAAQRGILANPPIRPRADGEVVHFERMGSIDPSLLPAEARETDPPADEDAEWIAYTFEVVGEGRGRAIIFDAAHRDRVVLRVNVGKDAQMIRKTGDPVRPPAAKARLEPRKAPHPAAKTGPSEN